MNKETDVEKTLWVKLDLGWMECKDCGHLFKGDRERSRCPKCTSNRVKPFPTDSLVDPNFVRENL